MPSCCVPFAGCSSFFRMGHWALGIEHFHGRVPGFVEGLVSARIIILEVLKFAMPGFDNRD